MSAIHTSLSNLNNAVQKLESALESKKTANAAAARKGNANQPDMFATMTAGRANPSNMNPANVRMLATRLDNAIDQVEKILKEGQG